MTRPPLSARSLVHTAGLLLACALVAATIATGPARARPPADGAGEPRARSSGRTLPGIVGAGPKVRQMITISSQSFDSTSGTLRAWRRDAHDEWVLARGPVQVVVGYGGWVKARERRQGTGTTPAGRFRLPYAFGNAPDPGARLSYRQVDAGDWWPYEPRDAATYNVYQPRRAVRTRWRPDYAEHLVTYGAQYGYALVVGFNLPSGVHYSTRRQQWVARNRADTARGGGIFLHVRGDGLTAGCVAMNRREMRWLVRWVSPGAQPRLVMGPRSYIRTL